MSTYFCSDLHGEYYLFCKALDAVGFSSSDKLYVLGDILDKGKDSLRLLDLIRSMPNAYTLIGNHEYMFLRYYNNALKEAEGDGKRLFDRLQEFYPNERMAFTPEQIRYLSSLPYFIEGKTFFAVHAGVALGEGNRVLPMERQDTNVLLFDRKFKSDEVVPDDSKTVLFGHTPCSYDNGTGKMIKTLRKGLTKATRFTDYAKIRLDTGVALTGTFGLFRANDMAEFYVTKE